MGTKPIPLYSDVDGTLIRTDLLIEGVCAMIKRQPWRLFALPFWLLRGKAFLKTRIADHAQVEADALPYNKEFVEFLESESRKGREIYLASASEERFVSAIADHLRFVRGIVATGRSENIKGLAKATAIRSHCGGSDFAYAGNSRADLPVWREATEGVLVNTPAGVERAARSLTTVTHAFRVPKAGIRTYLKAIRLHQWLKNLLVFVPLFAGHSWNSQRAVLSTFAMFFTFGLVASGTYVINDLLDLSSDRRHPSKRRRPIAAGQLPLANAAMLGVALMLLGTGCSTLISIRATLVLVAYVVSTMAYSFWLKRFVMVDALTLAGLYTVRIIGGATAVAVRPSVWLLAFSGFLFLSLGLLKRCSELGRMAQLNQASAPGRGYRVSDDLMLRMMGVASGYISALVAALYINSSPALEQYKTPEALWLICPFLLYWVSRMWIKTGRGEMHDDPLVFSARDRVSWIVFAAVVFTWAMAHFPL